MPCLSFEEPLAPYAHWLMQSGLPVELKKYITLMMRLFDMR